MEQVREDKFFSLKFITSCECTIYISYYPQKCLNFCRVERFVSATPQKSRGLVSTGRCHSREH